MFGLRSCRSLRNHNYYMYVYTQFGRDGSTLEWSLVNPLTLTPKLMKEIDAIDQYCEDFNIFRLIEVD